MSNLTGKIAIVTGGAKGMGASHAKALVASGAQVVITDILEERGQALADELGENAIFVKHDVSKAADWEKVVAVAEEKFGAVNVLVNNAGIAILEKIQDITEEKYLKVFQVNQLSVFLGMKTVFPSMVKAGSGAIVNISSISGKLGTYGGIAYDASKFAVNGMTKSAALDFAPYNIKVNAIMPGFIDTDMDAQMDKDYMEIILKTTPAARRALPEEVSSLMLYLVSDECKFQTAGEYVIDGGLTSTY